jgi:hypothetical protein
MMTSWDFLGTGLQDKDNTNAPESSEPVVDGAHSQTFVCE